MTIYPVILSGGVGSRLWPTSRSLYPKQLLPLVSERAMLQETALRVSGGDMFAAPIIVSNDEHRFIIAQQMREAGLTPLAHILEPQGRNTAPAAAAAAAFVQTREPRGIVLILPADHHIADVEAFRRAVAAGAAPARAVGARNRLWLYQARRGAGRWRLQGRAFRREARRRNRQGLYRGWRL